MVCNLHLSTANRALKVELSRGGKEGRKGFKLAEVNGEGRRSSRLSPNVSWLAKLIKSKRLVYMNHQAMLKPQTRRIGSPQI